MINVQNKKFKHSVILPWNEELQIMYIRGILFCLSKADFIMRKLIVSGRGTKYGSKDISFWEILRAKCRKQNLEIMSYSTAFQSNQKIQKLSNATNYNL